MPYLTRQSPESCSYENLVAARAITAREDGIFDCEDTMCDAQVYVTGGRLKGIFFASGIVSVNAIFSEEQNSQYELAS